MWNVPIQEEANGDCGEIIGDSNCADHIPRWSRLSSPTFGDGDMFSAPVDVESVA